MIDSHCHLDHEPLFTDISDVISRSKKIGINKLLTICTTIKSFENILKLINLDNIIYGTFGIHPHESDNDVIKKEKIIHCVAKHNKIIGIGETGLDFFYNHSNYKRQISSFKEHIEASIETNLPLIVHSRDAENETYKILETYKKHNLKILMHCFTGTKEFSKKLLDLNAYFSASGIITFKNSYKLQETFKVIPSEKLLVETDSPFLAPVPMRGKKNEPSYIVHTLKKLAELKNISEDEIIKITTNNFESLFSNQ
jgi:TatD DNase family protein